MDEHLFAVRSPLEVGDRVMLHVCPNSVYEVNDILVVHSARHADVQILYDLGVMKVTLDLIKGRLVGGTLVPVGEEQARSERMG